MDNVRTAENLNRQKGGHYQSMRCPECAGAGCLICGHERVLYYDGRNVSAETAAAAVVKGDYSKTWNAADLVRRLMISTEP